MIYLSLSWEIESGKDQFGKNGKRKEICKKKTENKNSTEEINAKKMKETIVKEGIKKVRIGKNRKKDQIQKLRLFI